MDEKDTRKYIFVLGTITGVMALAIFAAATLIPPSNDIATASPTEEKEIPEPTGAQSIANSYGGFVELQSYHGAGSILMEKAVRDLYGELIASDNPHDNIDGEAIQLRYEYALRGKNTLRDRQTWARMGKILEDVEKFTPHHCALLTKVRAEALTSPPKCASN